MDTLRNFIFQHLEFSTFREKIYLFSYLPLMKPSFLKYFFFPVFFLLVFQGEGRGEVFSGFGKEVGEETAACVKEHSNEALFLLIKNADNDAIRIRYSKAWNHLDLAESSSKLDPTVLTKLGDDLLNADFATYLEGGIGRVKEWERFLDGNIDDAIRLSPEWLIKLSDDLAHPTWGDEIAQLLDEIPADVKDIWKKLKDDPAFHWEILDDGAGFAAGSRWEKWSQREFFKFVTKKGKDFENLVTGIAKNGSEPPFSVWLIDGFIHHGQLHIENLTGGKRIVGDDVFIKNDIDDLGVSFKRAIFHDSKLSSGSPWTPNQKSELIDIFSNDPTKQYIEFEVRTANNLLPPGSPVSQGQIVRVYREDVFKTISNGSENIGSTNQVFQ